MNGMKSTKERWPIVERCKIGELWWVEFPFDEVDIDKRRPAIIIDDEHMAVLGMYVTSKNKENPYSIEITYWKEAGLSQESWARIDKIISIDEWRLDRKIGALEEPDLLKMLQLVTEFQNQTFHEFSLLVVKRSDGRLLQLYDDRWESWLFPYFRTSEDANAEMVDKRASELLNTNIVTSYVVHEKHCKYSVSDDTYKIYHHKLYKALIDDLPEHISADSFELDGKSFKWMSISELENDTRIVEVNDDIIAFVKAKC